MKNTKGDIKLEIQKIIIFSEKVIQLKNRNQFQ